MTLRKFVKFIAEILDKVIVIEKPPSLMSIKIGNVLSYVS